MFADGLLEGKAVVEVALLLVLRKLYGATEWSWPWRRMERKLKIAVEICARGAGCSLAFSPKVLEMMSALLVAKRWDEITVQCSMLDGRIFLFDAPC